jgi:hypothetical protein
MPRYGSARDSGIVRYALGEGWIDVTFKDGWTYRYTDATSGAECVRAMKALARAGRGLNTYINQRVRDRYADKRR